ncbi:MAG: glycosyltransferase family 4 protein [Ignavibacteriae bacterium]|nr:glycosyltransferase family 4 protein [Ignavibacteriota bacterium]
MNIGMLLDKEFYGDMRVENEVQALSKEGFKVFVYCFTFDGQFHEGDFYGATIVNIPVSRKFIRKLRALTNTIFNFYPNYLVKLIEKYLLKHSIDILHIHDLYLFEVGLKLKKKNPHLKLVGDLHENYVEGLKSYKFANTFPGNVLISIKKWEQKEKEWCGKFDYLITVIEEAVERYKGIGIPEQKLNVVANYVNLDSFLNVEDDEDVITKLNGNFTLLYIGGFDIHRGLESVVKSIPKTVKEIKNFHLVLVGRGKNENDLKNIASELNISQHITFEGFQPAAKLPSYIKGSSICLVPHLKTVHTDNTIPHKLFHYMILEKPVVASNCNPIERIVKETNCGLVYESNNENDFAEKVIELYKDQSKQILFGANGKKGVIEKYNWNVTSKNLIKLYKEVQSKTRRK